MVLINFFLHPSESHTGEENLYLWNNSPEIIALILGLLLAYFVIVGPRRKDWVKDSPFPKKEFFNWILGIFFLYVAIASPIDHIGEKYLFWVHMIQHILLIFVTPLFCLLAIPAWMGERIFSKNSRLKKITHPLCAGLIFNGVFIFWHIPYFYELALINKPVHDLEHLTFVLAAFIMWWPIIRPVKSWEKHPSSTLLLYLFVVATFQIPLFILLTFAQDLWYPFYGEAARLEGILNMAPMEDQSFGGIIMKIIAGIAYFSAFVYVWLKWAKD